MVHITKNDAVLDKFNLEKITAFITDKFENLSTIYLDSALDQKKLLLSSIFPNGVQWSENGYSNSEINPYWSAILGLENDDDHFGGQYWTRTSDLYNVNVAL